MTVEQRREQLLEVGRKLFAADPSSDISIDAVIEQAGVSRALFYHYFPSKRDFFIETFASAAERIMIATAPRPDLAPIDRLRAAIDGYLDLVEAEPTAFRTVFRGGLISDPQVRKIHEINMERQKQRLLEVVAPDGKPSELLDVAIVGWLWFVIHTCLEWLETGSPSRDELRDLFADVFVSLLTAAS